MNTVPTIRMNNGVEIPQVGFGVFQIEPAKTSEMVLTAFDAGYRHVDTAQAYGNEAQVGQAVAQSGLKRDEIFLATKLDQHRHGYDSAIAELDKSLERLGTDYVDLYLIHYPAPGKDEYLQTWRAFETLLANGKARAIGVSNLQATHLRWLAERSDTVPAINQIELHPNVPRAEMRRYHREHGIVTEAWSPIARGRALEDATIGALAEKYGKSPAQVILRWHVQIGNVPLSKSVTPSRIRENITIFDFEIDADDMALIHRLDGDPDGAPDHTVEAGLPKWYP